MFHAKAKAAVLFSVMIGMLVFHYSIFGFCVCEERVTLIGSCCEEIEEASIHNCCSDEGAPCHQDHPSSPDPHETEHHEDDCFKAFAFDPGGFDWNQPKWQMPLDFGQPIALIETPLLERVVLRTSPGRPGADWQNAPPPLDGPTLRASYGVYRL